MYRTVYCLKGFGPYEVVTPKVSVSPVGPKICGHCGHLFTLASKYCSFYFYLHNHQSINELVYRQKSCFDNPL